MKKIKNIPLFLFLISFFYIVFKIINEKCIVYFESSKVYYIVDTITYLLSFFPVIFYFKKTMKENQYFFERKNLRFNNFIFYLGIMIFINFIMVNARIGYNNESKIIYNYESTTYYIITNIILSSLIAPILEEIIFRGILMNNLMKYGYKVAIITNSVLFGFYHININAMGRTILAGIILSYITYRYSLKYSIKLHIILNIIANLGKYLYYNDYIMIAMGIFTVVLIIIFIIGLIRKKYKEIFSIFKLNNEDRKNIIKFVKDNALYLLVILVIVISNLLFNYKLF